MEGTREIQVERLAGAVAGLPGLDALRAAAGERSIYLVGGAVRDILLGLPVSEFDVVVEGDAGSVAETIGGEVKAHERFRTATASLDGRQVDLVTARRESYPRPGALPEIEPASISEDLARRDFTINAMAVPIDRAPALLDPHGGVEDLRRGLLRVLHPASFVDDPTRALRAARYSVRFGFELERETEAELVAADLTTVSQDRVDAELRKIAAEEDPAVVFELLDEWGVIALPEGALEAIRTVLKLLEEPHWRAGVERSEAVVGASRPAPPEVRALCVSNPGSPSEIARLAAPRTQLELLLARARGAGWLDEWSGRLRGVRLEIGGEDLLAAGVPEGPAVGRALDAALEAKLEGRASSREEELEVALREARTD